VEQHPPVRAREHCVVSRCLRPASRPPARGGQRRQVSPSTGDPDLAGLFDRTPVGGIALPSMTAPTNHITKVRLS
jgi:hypothetical protein